MPKQLLQGNQAIAMAAEIAGLKFFAGYPITPASEIIHEMVNKKHIKTLQMEDEIASVNAVIGASLAGLKAMTATSGPGFSLMQESIGLAHMMEVPLVIVNVQRVGPSTGMPTMPAQGMLFNVFTVVMEITFPLYSTRILCRSFINTPSWHLMQQKNL